MGSNNTGALSYEWKADGETIPSFAVKYKPADFTPFDGAEFSKDAGCIAGLERANAGFSLPGIDGRDGGRATIWVKYITTERWAKLRLNVNGRDESFINCLAPEGVACLTVRLNPGRGNKVILTGGEGDVRVTEAGVSYQL